MNYLNSLAPTSRILSNEIKTISKLVGEGEGEGGNICTNKILGSLEILAIKNDSFLVVVHEVMKNQATYTGYLRY